MNKELKRYRDSVMEMLVTSGITIITDKHEKTMNTIKWLHECGMKFTLSETLEPYNYAEAYNHIIVKKEINTMNAIEFIQKTIGRKYDIDGSYGYQCWDYFALFCKQMGYPVFDCTITGYVKDIWNARKTSGILNYFNETVTPKTGDWVIYGNSRTAPDSHIGMIENFGKNTILVVSQNQGAPQVTRVMMSTEGVLGYLRPKAWEINTTFLKVGDMVTPTIAKSYDNVPLDKSVLNNSYPIIEISHDRVVLGNGLNTAFHLNALKLSTINPSKPIGITIGSKVRVIKLEDYNGNPLAHFVANNVYTVMEISGDRVVIGVDGAVTCACKISNLRLA